MATKKDDEAPKPAAKRRVVADRPKPGQRFMVPVHPEGLLPTYTFRELLEGVEARVPHEDDGERPEWIEWYCWNQDCWVREVEARITSHLPSGPLPRMRCPACGEVMSRQGSSDTLFLVREPETERK